VYELKKVVKTEFNIEGYPSKDFMKLIEDIRPAQATLVPDAPDVITSNAGWNTIQNKNFLADSIAQLKSYGVRTSVFIDADEKMIEHAEDTGTDRIELYTEDYAKHYRHNREHAIAPFIKAAKKANEMQLGINAGHDLNLDNLRYFAEQIPNLLEVSIGHAIISDALYLGLENTVQMYLRCLKKMS